jgi:hypothetical protein
MEEMMGLNNMRQPMKSERSRRLFEGELAKRKMDKSRKRLLFS